VNALVKPLDAGERVVINIERWRGWPADGLGAV